MTFYDNSPFALKTFENSSPKTFFEKSGQFRISQKKQRELKKNFLSFSLQFFPVEEKLFFI